MDDKIFQTGKHVGKKYSDVRINYSEYFLFLITQPAGNVYNYFDFIEYCMKYIKVKYIIE